MKDKTMIFGKKFKLIYAITQIILFYLSVSFFPGFDLLALICLVIIYLIPLFINSYGIKFLDVDKKISRYYFEDFLYYYLPSVATSLVCEIVLYFSNVYDLILGFFTVVLFIVFTLLTLFQWFRYFIQYKTS